MVNLTDTGHLKAEAVPIDGRSFRQVWPGGEDAMVDFNIEGRTPPHSQPLQEAKVNNDQEVKSTPSSRSVKEKTEAKTERRRVSQQHENAVNNFIGFKLLMAGCLLFLPSAYGNGNDASGNNQLSRTLEVKRAATPAELAIMDNARKKETSIAVEPVHQRLERRDLTTLNPMNVNMSKKVGDKVEYPFTCPSNFCKIDFRNQTAEHDIPICSTEKTCILGYKIDDKGVFVFNAGIGTAGEYRVIEFNTKATEGSLYLSLENAAEPSKSGATFNELSFALMIAICVLVYCIG